MKTFNLDDENEVQDFITTYSTTKGRRLANLLGFKGKGCVNKADDLSNYAWNKIVAINNRKQGKIETALKYEKICERIYARMDSSIKW